MTWRASGLVLSVLTGWVLWTHSFESAGNSRSVGTWTPVLTTDSRAHCEATQREQVTSLLNGLPPHAASIDPDGNAVYYTTRDPDGRPVMLVTRYHCLPATVDPRGDRP